MVKVFWTYQAKLDLKEIFNFIAKNSKKYAHLQVHEIRESIKLLKSQQKLGKICKDFHNPEVREIISTNYRIVYLIVDKNRIDILFVHHGNRDLEKRISNII